METISYGITRDYLSHWGVNEALREIMQNFLDYGDYKVHFDRDTVTLSSNYVPDDLTFLGLGKSVKKEGSRGKYGEGLKMALFIFCREDKGIQIQLEDKYISPCFIKSSIGEVFALEIYEGVLSSYNNFNIHLQISLEEWDNFNKTIIKKEDVIFDDNYYGQIVNKEKGNIYCGGLFVSNVTNISKAYNIKPQHLQLDRDRKMLPQFDINWACSKINEAQGKMKVTDLTYSDTEYITTIPASVKKQIKPRLVGNSIEATYKHKGKTVVIKNNTITNIVRNDSFFQRTVKRLKMFLLKQTGLYKLLIEFRDKHIKSEEAKKDFEIILNKVQNE